MEKLFKADWKLDEFKNLIEAGLKMGSKYFFLVGCAHGLYFMVRDTDSEGLDSNPKRFPNEVYEVFAEGFERELGVEELNEKVAELYKGDICQWFRLSEQLLLFIKNKIDEGYTKIRMLSNPLVLPPEFNELPTPEGNEKKQVTISSNQIQELINKNRSTVNTSSSSSDFNKIEKNILEKIKN